MRSGVIIDDLNDDEFGFARWYLRAKRLRSEILERRQHSWESRNSE